MRLEDITEARLLLEKGLAELAIEQCTDEDLDELQDYVNKAFDKIKQGVPAHKENIQFHIQLYQSTHNPLLTMVYSSVMDLFLLTLEILPAEFEASRVVAQEHNQIIAHLKTGQLDELSALLNRHISEANNRLLAQAKKVNNSKNTLLGNQVSDLAKTLIGHSD